MRSVKRNWVADHARLMTFDRLTNTIDALVKAHNAYLIVCNESCEERDDGSFATDAEIDAAFDARADVIVELISAQMAYCQAHLSPGNGASDSARWDPTLPISKLYVSSKSSATAPRPMANRDNED
jgi:hypothetical protein